MAGSDHRLSTFRRNLWLANCYFSQDSSGFPVLLRFCDARSGRSFHPLHRYPGPLARTWRRPFHTCGVASPQAPTPDRESPQAPIAESMRVGPHPRRFDGALGASYSSAPVRNRTEALNTARPPQSLEQAKVPHAVLTESPSEARSERTERRTHSCGRRNEGTQSQLGLSANRTTDGLGVPHPNRQGRGSKDSRPSLPAGTALRWSLLADFPGPNERQPLEYRSVPVRVGHVADPLGPGRHGSIHAPHPWVRRPCGPGRWCRTLSDVQPRHSRPTLHAEVPELRQRSALSLPPVASQSADSGGDRNQVPPLRSPVSSVRGKVIGTLRREYLDHMLFWTTVDLENKLLDFRSYFNHHRTHTSREGRTPDPPASRPAAHLRSFRWQPHCRALYHTPVAA